MLHSDLFPEFGCDRELIEIPELCTQILTVTWCERCGTELSWVADDGRWVNVVYPGMKEPIE
jgi:hypothetical protein